MRLTKLIKGEELENTKSIHNKTYSMGSKLQWGNKVWEIIKSPDGCGKCYFNQNGTCYREGVWREELGECSAIARPDNENVAFQLHYL